MSTNPSDVTAHPEQRAGRSPSEELELLKKHAADYLAGWQRAKADYLNLKRESEREKQELIKFANAGLLMELFPIYDNLKRAIARIPQENHNAEWVQGIQHIYEQFKQFFQELGIQEIKTVGETFDPRLHHAVDKERREGVAHGTILEEVKTGFTMHDKLIEPAKVRVAE